MLGQAGNDSLECGSGADFLSGGDDDDMLGGTTIIDSEEDDAVVDVLLGDAGFDQFFSFTNNIDLLLDFNDQEDEHFVST